MVKFLFSEDGKKHLYRFTKRFSKRRVAILVNGKLTIAPVVWVPVFSGDRVVIPWLGTNKELAMFVDAIAKERQSLISLYADEVVTFNEVAADAWADVFENMNQYIEEKRKQCLESPAYDSMEESID